VSNIREQISGGAEEQQMAAELRRLPRSQLSRLLQEGRFAQVRIPDGHLLGLKTGLNLNWSQCRDLRRYYFISLSKTVSITHGTDVKN